MSGYGGESIAGAPALGRMPLLFLSKTRSYRASTPRLGLGGRGVHHVIPTA